MKNQQSNVIKLNSIYLKSNFIMNLKISSQLVSTEMGDPLNFDQELNMA